MLLFGLKNAFLQAAEEIRGLKEKASEALFWRHE